MQVKSPNKYKTDGKLTVFLAGSIEMGTAEDWQKKVTEAIDGSDVLILNPRRDDWDSSWVQSIKNKQFNEQVNWEMDAMNAADIIIFYFSPDTKSPISLLELGLHAPNSSKWLMVCCPEGFWRKGNVEIVCDRFNRTLWTDLDKMISEMPETFEVLKKMSRLPV